MASDPRLLAAPIAPNPEHERLIEDQLLRTRRQLKAVDLAVALLTLAAGGLIYLLAMVLVDHWLVPHGLNPTARLIAFVVLLVALVVYSGWALLPLLARRINPLFAAQTIERGHPSLKNSVINFLLLRSRAAQMPSVVFEAMEQRAASD